MTIFHIRNFWNFDSFPDWKFVEFCKLKIHEIFPIEKLTNFQNFKILNINKFSESFQFGKLSKFQKLTNFEIFVHPIFRTNRHFSYTEKAKLPSKEMNTLLKYAINS